MPPYPWAYNYSTCPKRTDGGSHETDPDSTLCRFCKIRIVAVQHPNELRTSPPVPEVREVTPEKVIEEVVEPEVARRGDWPKIARVPEYLKVEYYAVRNKIKCDDEFAQGFVAKLHGLEPGGRDTWTLRQLAKLEFLRWLARERPNDVL